MISQKANCSLAAVGSCIVSLKDGADTITAAVMVNLDFIALSLNRRLNDSVVVS